MLVFLAQPFIFLLLIDFRGVLCYYFVVLLSVGGVCMTKAEYLEEKYRQHAESYKQGKAEFFAHPSIARIEPFKIADQLYYVGDKKVCIHLIDTGDGLILLDSGFLKAEHLLVDSIWRAGFDPAHIKWIIHSHGHTDHYGASEEFRRMYGAKLAISRIDAEKLRRKKAEDYTNYSAPDFDYEIEDGEVFELGNVKIRCVLTPGHTEGVLSFFFNVTYNSKTYLAGMYGGAGVAAISLPNINHYGAPLDSAEQMLASIELVRKEPVEVHLGNHPYNNHTLEKREKQLAEGGNPFIDKLSWPDFLDELKDSVCQKIKENEQMKKEMENLD